MTARRIRPLLLVALLSLAAGCAPKRLALPSGAGDPFPSFADAYRQAISTCSRASTLTAALGLSGRAGATKLRGRIDAGFAAPASLRLEGVAPFGKPVFILVAQGERATLLLPRDNRVLRDAATGDIIQALAGVKLDGAQLRGVLAGCGFLSGDPTAGRQYPNGWAALDFVDTTTYLRQSSGAWRVVASQHDELVVEYAELAAAYPASVRIRTTGTGERDRTDLTLKLSQVEINVPLDGRVFDVDVPRDAAPLTLDELRRAGPLGAARR